MLLLTRCCLLAALLTAQTGGDSVESALKADDQSRDAIVERCKTVFDGMSESYERLRSGEYDAVGIHEIPERNSVEELELSGTFDLDCGCSRHFRREVRGGEASYLQVLTSDSRLGWMSSSSGQAGIHFPESVTDLAETQRPLITPWSMSVSHLSQLDRPFPEIVGDLGAARSVNAVVSADTVKGLIRLVWHRPDDSRSWVLWVDPAMGYVPTRYQVGNAHTATPHEMVRLQHESETTWKDLAGVFVPETWTAQRYGVGTQSVELRYSLSFQWTAINEAIDESVFTWRGAGLPKGTSVYDDRLGKTILVGRVGMELPPEEVFEGQPQGVPYLAPSLSRTTKWLWAAIAMSVLLVFGVIAVYLRRRSG